MTAIFKTSSARIPTNREAAFRRGLFVAIGNDIFGDFARREIGVQTRLIAKSALAHIALADPVG